MYLKEIISDINKNLYIKTVYCSIIYNYHKKGNLKDQKRYVLFVYL